MSEIPRHDILCAGFPCQPFSKAGEQQGFLCPKEGDLFKHVMRIVRHHKPLFVILENVPNLRQHNDGNTWRHLESRLWSAGYDVDSTHLSPHQFGIPQIRERVFIVASRHGLSHFAWPRPQNGRIASLRKSLDLRPKEARPLSLQVRKCLVTWQKFIKQFPKKVELPSFPIWSMEFGADYPYEETTPFKLGGRKLRSYRGGHGTPLKEVPPEKRIDFLPSYARTKQAKFPHWKVQLIRQNRNFYKKYKHWIKPWLPRILEFPPSLQKLEWNCKGEKRDIWRYVIQFRASGVRVKRPTTAPSLIAMTTTQVPIIAWEKRYMTPRECARLQSMDGVKYLPEFPTVAFRALGNAVNVDLVEMVARSLLKTSRRKGSRKYRPSLRQPQGRQVGLLHSRKIE